MFVDKEKRETLPSTNWWQSPATIKLSEAIRIGASKRPQGYTQLFHNGKSCALGAAYEGLTGRSDAWYTDVYDAFPLLREGPCGPSPLTREIWIRNDCLRWSREQIAEWLEAQGL